MQLSNSSIRLFKTCRRSWWLQHYLGWGTKPANQVPVGAMHLGSRVHLALEAHYGYDLDPIRALEVIYAAVIRERPEFTDELTKEHAYARVMTSGYLDWAAEEGLDAALEVAAVEKVVSYAIDLGRGQSVTLVGKLDQIVRRLTDGAMLFRDWKTVGTLKKANGIVRDEQMRFYSLLQALIGDETGVRADGGLYTMLLRSKRTARARGPFYEQVEVRFNRHDLSSMLARVEEEARDILRMVDRINQGGSHLALAYPNPGDHCDFACPFTQVCPMFDDGSRATDMLAANYAKVDPWAYYGDGLMEQVKRELTPADQEESDTGMTEERDR